MRANLDMDDWSFSHERQAAAQGWCLLQFGVANTANAVQIHKIEEVDLVSEKLGVDVPNLPHDQAAVEKFRQAYEQGQLHAQVAYRILQTRSPSEFHYWHMHHW